MSAAGYRWRQLNQKQREELLEWRKARGYPWHSPPHRPNFGHLRFLVSAACYKHRHYIGQSLARMDNSAGNLLAVLRVHANQTFACCVLPNHYHALVRRQTSRVWSINWGGFTAAVRTLGTLKNRLAGERFSSVPSNARCVRIGITGRRLITFIIIPCGTATCGIGRIGRGAARRNIWPKQMRARRSVSGGITRSTRTARIGMIRECSFESRL